MAAILTTLLAVIPIIDSSSRYFIYTFSNPFSASSNVPYPLDVCITYDVSIHRFRPFYTHAMFTCNPHNDGIIMTTYGSDSDCASEGTLDSIYSAESFNKTGDLYSFNCIGEDNLVEALLYENDDTCCGSGSYTASRIVTDICYIEDDGRYVMTTCDENGIGTTYISHTAGCNDDNTTVISGNNDECKLFKSKPRIYLRLNKCIRNGSLIEESTHCRTSTAAPTSPTAPTTHRPTMKPSVSPTVNESAVFGDMSLTNGMIFGGCIVMIMIGIGIYCCIKRRQKQSYRKQEGLIEAGYSDLERIALDNVVENKDENNDENEDENQEIIGSAEEIDIAAIDPVINS